MAHSKHQLHGDLNVPWQVVAGTADNAEIRSSQGVGRLSEIWVVQDIEELGAELQ